MMSSRVMPTSLYGGNSQRQVSNSQLSALETVCLTLLDTLITGIYLILYFVSCNISKIHKKGENRIINFPVAIT